jgi:CDP-diacylglycerol--serine O-phosphatidyltransferase
MRKPVAMLPNFITLGNLFFGFWSVVASLDQNFPLAALFIFIAAVLDALDGKVARFVQTGGTFGVELDSLCDVVSFGVAPSVLMYAVYFSHINTGVPFFNFLLVVISFLPLGFGAFRLARFNLSAVREGHKDHFEGLPIPVAAVTLASFVWFNYSVWGRLAYGPVLLPLILAVGLLMISRIPYQTMPRLTIRDSRSNRIKLVLLVTVVLALLIFQSLALFPIAVIFILTGIIKRLIRGPIPLDVEETDDIFNDTAF